MRKSGPGFSALLALGLLRHQYTYGAPSGTFHAGSALLFIPEESDNGVTPPVHEAQGAAAVELLAGLHADSAKDALVGVIVEAKWGRVRGQLFMRRPEASDALAVDTEVGHQLLQLAFPVAGTAPAGCVVVGNQQFGYRTDCPVYLRTLRLDRHPRLYRRPASGDHSVVACFHHAESADPLSGKLGVEAQMGDVDVIFERCLQDGRPFVSLYGHTIDCQRYLLHCSRTVTGRLNTPRQGSVPR